MSGPTLALFTRMPGPKSASFTRMSGPKAALENDFYGCGPAVALQDAGFSRGGARSIKQQEGVNLKMTKQHHNLIHFY